MAIFGDTFELLFILTSDHTACQVPTSNEQQRKFSSEKRVREELIQILIKPSTLLPEASLQFQVQKVAKRNRPLYGDISRGSQEASPRCPRHLIKDWLRK